MESFNFLLLFLLEVTCRGSWWVHAHLMAVSLQFNAPAGRIAIKDLNLPESGYQISASGRADRNANNMPKRAKSLKNTGSLKHQGQNEVEHPIKVVETVTYKQLDVQVVDVGPPVDSVKINVRETDDSFEVYVLVPGLLRNETGKEKLSCRKLDISSMDLKTISLLRFYLLITTA
ncbi:hypothetical protein KY290_012207 [Solanum tuberosum]|uniref:Uncharacterized protein n=1 Tax=Solanum tuberosum TaxID=4113 RepID=A0ABQ7W397_SOLTU|nr:hypothetical protein KY290_012207 [Solanum tuberosum]